MATTKKTNINKSSTKGIKGGVSMISPEIVGAMTGAAIGGVAGLMLANQKTRENLAVGKDKAIDTAGEDLSNVNIETSGMKDDVKKNVNQVSIVAAEKLDKKISKK